MIVRERKAQTATNTWADAVGIPRTTLTLRGRRGWPDEVYWVPGGRPLLIEFKAEGEEPRKLQLYIHTLLRQNGYEIQAHYKAAEAINAIKTHIKNCTGRDFKIAKRPTRVDSSAVPKEGNSVPTRKRQRRLVP